MSPWGPPMSPWGPLSPWGPQQFTMSPWDPQEIRPDIRRRTCVPRDFSDRLPDVLGDSIADMLMIEVQHVYKLSATDQVSEQLEEQRYSTTGDRRGAEGFAERARRLGDRAVRLGNQSLLHHLWQRLRGTKFSQRGGCNVDQHFA